MANDITVHQPLPEDLSSCNPNSQHQFWSKWVFEVRVEGKPALDPRYQELVRLEAAKWFAANFGRTGQMRMTVYWEAGNLGTGKPSPQLLMMPQAIDSTAIVGG